MGKSVISQTGYHSLTWTPSWGADLYGTNSTSVNKNLFDGSSYGFFSNTNYAILADQGNNHRSSKISNNIIQNNISSAAQAEKGNTSLQITCNAFNNQGYATYGTRESELPDQGYCNEIHKNPAGNDFNYHHNNNCDGFEHIYDRSRFHGTSLSNSLLYYHHEANLDFPNVKPVCINDKVFNKNCEVPKNSIYCNQGPGGYAIWPPDENSADIMDNIDENEGIVTDLENSIDNGNTQALLTTIDPNQNNTDQLIFDSLQNNHPNSDTVLLALNARQPAIHDTMFTHIMTDNSPLSDSVYTAVKNDGPALPDSLMNEIDSAQTGISDKDKIEKGIVYFQRQRQLYVNRLIRYYRFNNKKDSTIIFLEEEKPLASRILLTPMYIDSGLYLKAQNLLDTIPQTDSTFMDYVTIQQLNLDLVLSGRGYFDLDSIELETVQNVAQHKTPTATNAQVILHLRMDTNAYIALDTINRHLPVQLAPPSNNQNKKAFISGKEERPIHDKKRKAGRPGKFEIYPNPAGDNLLVSIPVANRSTGNKLYILNLDGQIMKTLNIQNNQEVKISTHHLSRGLYLVQWVTDREVRATRKLVIR